MEYIRLEFIDHFVQARLEAGDDTPLVHQRQAMMGFCRHRGAVENEAVVGFDEILCIALLGGGDSSDIPAIGLLEAHDLRGAEGIAVGNREGVIEDVEDPAFFVA